MARTDALAPSSMLRVLALLALMAFPAGCRDVPDGGYLEISGRLFVFNYRLGMANYLVTLSKLRPLPEGAVLNSAFENPAGGEPLRKSQPVWPLNDKITVESPPIHCVVADRAYKVTLRLTDREGRELQTIETVVISNVDQSVMPDQPLVVGPLYDANPAAGSSAPDHSCPKS